jgi:hypothetical protein
LQDKGFDRVPSGANAELAPNVLPCTPVHEREGFVEAAEKAFTTVVRNALVERLCDVNSIKKAIFPILEG